MGAISNSKISSFWHPAPQVRPLGHDPGDTMIIPFDMFYNVFVRTHTKFGTQIFELNFVVEIKWHSTFWPNPKITRFTIGWEVYLHSALLIICVNLICHLTFFDPSAPPASPCPTHGAWPRHQNNSPVRYVLYLLFERTHAKFGIKKTLK